ncbi:hypothetical protein Hamer_G004531 [Homarus americanus]|uniref:Uncharacterized protein n=1 Tax=Homarus americanus TaxID=6706 RepID=A0A8J5JYI6_HOMAM|nr:hypothetical protein Hamer_G004531 [Homarus americanus]
MRLVGADTWQLLVVVAVLSTLLGVMLLMGGVWVCVVCRRRGSCTHLSRINWPRHGWGENNEEEGRFPPAQRGKVELDSLPKRAITPLDQHPPPLNAHINNSGISRGLGLGASCLPEQLPALPAPRSWTPSPPFDPHHKQTPPKSYNQASTNILNCDNDIARPVTCSRSRERGRKDGEKSLYGSRACTSPYKPRYNTPTSDHSLPPSTHTNSSSYITLGFAQKSKKRRGEAFEAWNTPSNACYNKRYKRRIRKATGRRSRRQRELDAIERNQNGRKWCDSHGRNHQEPSENTVNMLRGDGNVELPAACSSCCGTPPCYHQLPHPHVSIPESRHVEPFRTGCFYDLTSNPMKRSKMSTLVEGWKQGKQSKGRGNERVVEPSTPHLPPPNPPSPTTKRTSPPRRFMETQQERHTIPIVLTYPSPEPKPQWMQRFQASRNSGVWHTQRRQSHEPTHYNHHHCHQKHDDQQECDDPDRAVARRIALKYGFCQVCGIQKYHNQVSHLAGVSACPRKKSRCTQTQGDDTQELTHDPTPSLSWDNLTPDPSPALTDTLGNTRTPEGAVGTAALDSHAQPTYQLSPHGDDNLYRCNDERDHY